MVVSVVNVGFVVITFTEGKDEHCPLDHCVLNVVRFDDVAEADEYAKSLNGEGFPHVVSLNAGKQDA